MPEFLDPFKGLTPGRKLSPRELTRALRLALSAEEEAIHLYEALADATDHPLAKKVLQDVANEEREHAGEFQRLLNILLPDEESFMAHGAKEVDEMAAELKARKPASQKAAAKKPAAKAKAKK
ncbi:MAG: Rubrerythrin [Desulfarculus sp.]|nr:Rubrerythrin [Desulfarculus sp.]